METAHEKSRGTPVVTGATPAKPADAMVPSYIPGVGFTPDGVALIERAFRNKVVHGDPITERTLGVMRQRAYDNLVALGLRPARRR